MRTTRTIYLVPAAWSATGFCANGHVGPSRGTREATSEPALGGTLLTDRALTRLNLTLRETGGVLRGILWHQGGADSNNPHVRGALRGEPAEAGAPVAHRGARGRPRARRARRGRDDPVRRSARSRAATTIAAGSRSFSEEKRRVDEVHKNVANVVPHADVVVNDDLVPSAYPCGQSSCVHFGAAALREQGHRFDAALQRILAR